MPKAPDGHKRHADFVGMPAVPARITTNEKKSTSYASQMRRKSGVEGAKALAQNLTAERRSEIATQAAEVRRHKGEKEMSVFCSATLHGLLSGEGRELQNIKFLAGSSPTKEGMCAEAAKVIGSAIARGMPHNPPFTGMQKTKL